LDRLRAAPAEQAISPARVSAARPARGGLAATLAARDPGAPIAGNTIVVAGTGARVFGVPRRPNFIMALGANETISGGAENDQLGALGSNVTINGGAGDDLIFGGPGGTIAGGPGRDQLIERNPGGTILTGSGDEVIASGSHDRVVCSPGARDILIHRRPGDTISPTCRGDRARVLSIRRSGAQRARMAAAIEGNGSNATPYQTACTTKQKDSCTVSTFPARQLDGLWANEFVPAYQCPDDHQYLYFKNYAPPGTTIPHGVELDRDSDVGVSITATVRPRGADLIGRTYGTATGFPNSGATNWALGKRSYRVILHCTSFPNLAAMIF
jgi:hypothetical protein